jgi:hypothetical protein
MVIYRPGPGAGPLRRLERDQGLREATAAVGAPVVRAEGRSMTSQPIPPTGRVTSWDSVRKRALAVRLDLVRPDQRSGESSVGLTA